MEIATNSRVWIYQSNRPFSLKEEHTIKQKLNAFTSIWEAHGNKLTALAEIRYNRFIILMVDEEQAGATGCSIDKSVKMIKEIEVEYQVNLFDRFNMAYRDSAGISSCNREEFEKLITEGKVTENTIVFNNLVPTASELQNNWEITFKDSWHSKVFNNPINA